MNNLDYSKVFEVLVKETANYVKVNNLKAMVLGISGGIDSTVVAAICHEVSKQTGIPLIGRSLPIKNKSDEFDVSKLVGEALCNDFKVYKLERSYRAALFDACADAGDVNIANSYYLDELEEMPSRTLIANGNLQARCRMMYLYDIASRYKGLVMSTDNQTEYQLGFWTIHGDVGGFETDRDRDSAMTNVSSEDIAFIRSKSKWDSGTAENILRRHTMKYLNPSFYGQQ